MDTCVIISSSDQCAAGWTRCIELYSEVHYALLDEFRHVYLVLLFRAEIGTLSVILSSDLFVAEWPRCIELYSQCLRALLAQVYHAYLLLLSPVEIAECLILIVMISKQICCLSSVGFLT